MAGRLLPGLGRKPGDLAAFDEFHDVVLSDGTVGQRHLEHVTDLTYALPGGGFGEIVVAIPARLAGRVCDQFENPLRAGRYRAAGSHNAFGFGHTDIQTRPHKGGPAPCRPPDAAEASA